MSAGAAVVASDIEAFRKVLDDGRGGVLVPVDDAQALAAALLALLEDPPRRQALAAAGAAMARQYDWSTVAADVLAVYETVADGAVPVQEDRGGRLGRWRR
jgi:phosphatidylinositol alpha-mannosyltransferase